MSWVYQPLLPGAAQQTAASVSYTLVADSGAFSLGGQPALPRRMAHIAVTAGVIVETGEAAGFRRMLRLAANDGALGVTGHGAAFVRNLSLRTQHAVLAFTGQDAGFSVARAPISAGAASFALTVGSVSLPVSRRLSANAGALAMTGFPANPHKASPGAAEVSSVTLGLSISL